MSKNIYNIDESYIPYYHILLILKYSHVYYIGIAARVLGFLKVLVKIQLFAMKPLFLYGQSRITKHLSVAAVTIFLLLHQK